jgi:pimeloyl-ACP methyl ester carboxylesterase
MLNAFHAIHRLIIVIYLVLPAAALTQALVAPVRRRRRGALRRLWLSACGGMVMSSAVCVAWAAMTGGQPIIGQALAAAYFATGLLLLMRGFDRLLWRAATWALQLQKPGGRWWLAARVGLAGVLRGAVLFGVGLPYFLAATLTYQPHLAFAGDPQTILHRSFDRIEFRATDGAHLVGWWIAGDPAGARQTVLLCHGWASQKASDLFAVRPLIDDGYNVLSFDFRGHGESAGNLVGFVLGAVRWVAQNHPLQCRRLVGLGMNTGGAALLAAAVDPGPEGQRIDAVAVCGCFDTLADETRAVAAENFPRPVVWLAQHVGLPLAGMQLDDEHLPGFSPARAIAQLWPRPVLVIHGVEDDLVPLERGQALFEAAYPPRQFYWVEHAGQEAALHDAGAAAAVKLFFDTARSVL